MKDEEEPVSTDHREPEHHEAHTGVPPSRPGADGGTIAADLSIRSRMITDRTILSVEGELDLYSAPTLRDAVLAAASNGRGRLIIDLSAVPFMDSSGLGVIVACLKHIREGGGDLTVVTRPGSSPSKLLSLTGLDRAIPSYASTDEALNQP